MNSATMKFTLFFLCSFSVKLTAFTCHSLSLARKNGNYVIDGFCRSCVIGIVLCLLFISLVSALSYLTYLSYKLAEFIELFHSGLILQLRRNIMLYDQ